jgi:predicted N-formylglutamate amidohydrolase
VTSARVLRPETQGRFVLLCDHASNHIPPEFQRLGLPESDLDRHIAWDIGAAGVTESLSENLDSPAVLSGASRLLIDCNRPLSSTELIPAMVHGTSVPGNAALNPALRKVRIDRWYEPYHDAVESILRERFRRGIESIVVSIHSMTPVLHERIRPWQIALSSHTDRRLTDPVLAALRDRGDLHVGDNEPYCIDPLIDYSVPFHALRRGLRHLQVEFRQDEVETAAGQRQWAARFSDVLQKCVQTNETSR